MASCPWVSEPSAWCVLGCLEGYLRALGGISESWRADAQVVGDAVQVAPREVACYIHWAYVAYRTASDSSCVAGTWRRARGRAMPRVVTRKAA